MRRKMMIRLDKAPVIAAFHVHMNTRRIGLLSGGESAMLVDMQQREVLCCCGVSSRAGVPYAMAGMCWLRVAIG